MLLQMPGPDPTPTGRRTARPVLTLILLHGIAKVTGESGIGFVSKVVADAGLPAWVAYGVYIGEVVAPLAMIVGVWTRVAALLVALNMAVAVALVHRADLLRLGEGGGWALELQGMFLLSALAVALIGPGSYALTRS